MFGQTNIGARLMAYTKYVSGLLVIMEIVIPEKESVYIYIYIEREREGGGRERDKESERDFRVGGIYQ